MSVLRGLSALSPRSMHQWHVPAVPDVALAGCRTPGRFRGFDTARLKTAQRKMDMNAFMVLALTSTWITLVGGGWLVWQLLRQNGRLLLRIEELEQRLNELEFGEAAEPEGLSVEAADQINGSPQSSASPELGRPLTPALSPDGGEGEPRIAPDATATVHWHAPASNAMA